MRTGVVVTWRGDRGFGFIRPDGGDSSDVFVHISNVIGVDELHVGAKVSFDDGVSERTGRPEARNVRLAN
ncbi:cold shock domain-containing protein [Mesorhizobium loti]|uniref:Cold shock domain-containing protein n=2 Tax=Mesorhizobium jarvisii TaxID=1777867 RepID=A0A6M7TPN9_9HYPH|nr:MULTISPECIES: cold shock domain-containing protein [Mesorhizobium]OBQ58302.1 hypothetical protein A9K72_27915 [Mesorhizobium loti]QKC66964.1 cold shock domain-containing protein [Mesorhizobium jarvisii]QKD12877.1 cold shock domain-containing protein [Mesorhizobium loti]RJT30319.1 cold shock domain-containing protein [Mesorhizobium jarvisii]